MYKITNLSEDTSYMFRFQGVNAAGEGDWSPIPIGAKTKIKPPGSAFPPSHCHSLLTYIFLVSIVFLVSELNLSDM